VEPEGSQITSQYGDNKLDKQGYMHARICARPLALTHGQICKIFCFSTAKMIRERASTLRYTYIACIVILTLLNEFGNGYDIRNMVTKVTDNRELVVEVSSHFNFSAR
jgi:hypothetical protein